MTQITKKIIISNKSALTKKYGTYNYGLISQAINDLIQSDISRSIVSSIVYLDDDGDMQNLGIGRVTNEADEKLNKQAIDKIYSKLTPDYILLLGAQDIIPFQTLDNPITGDPDPNVPSDLPYSSASAYSTRISDFRNPTRVIGRIPGVFQGNDSKPLVEAIKTASASVSRDKSDYLPYFAVSAQVWAKSTEESVSNIFGNNSSLKISPPAGPNWSTDELNHKSHFINCHGAAYNPNWYGQKGSSYPEAVQASQIIGKISTGTIISAECCYGGELYNPGGICNTYLKNQAIGFCGSTNVAYGPPSGNGEADLVTQYFMIDVINGASTGRAMLQARQKYISKHPTLSSYDLKTLAQFYLLGDPSAHPVKSQVFETESKSFRPKLSEDHEALQRQVRRQQLLESGNNLHSTTRFAVPNKSIKPSKEVKDNLDSLIKELGISDTQIQSSTVEGGVKTPKRKSLANIQEHLIHEVSGVLVGENDLFASRVGIIITEHLGAIVALRTTHSKSKWSLKEKLSKSYMPQVQKANE